MEHTFDIALDKRARLAPFGPVWDGAGVRGFSREGYWYHPLVPGMSFQGSIFVTKTVTTYANEGNTPLATDYRPRDRFPKSIVPYFAQGMVLNAVGLSNPGVGAFLNTKAWFSIAEPFFISFMPILPETDPRAVLEVATFVHEIRKALKFNLFVTRALGIQLNISCPNVGADLAKVTAKAKGLLDVLQHLGLPIVVKINLLVSPEAAAEIASHPACTGLCIANSTPFGTVQSAMWWKERFATGSSLEKRGMPAGGLSGAPLLPRVIAWMEAFRLIDQHTYVNAGGGILHMNHVDRLKEAGADSVFLSSVAILRPWRVSHIIKRARECFSCE